MTIQGPPNDEMPPRIPEEDEPTTPIDTPDTPEQRAPGPDSIPVGAPRDEPDPDLS